MNRLERSWVRTLQSWGPHADVAAHPLCLSRNGTAAWSEQLYQGIASLRARRHEFHYAHRAAMGKWEYWAGSVAALNQMVDGALSGCHGRTVDDNALKCAVRFLDQRLLFGANVLASEMGELEG